MRIYQLLTSLLIFISITFFSFTISAKEYMFKHLEVKDGLSSNQINHIFKDSEGYMWFSTSSGLNRYDGTGIEVFRSYDLEKGPFGDNYIYDVQEAEDKKLWIHTGSGYSIYDPATESFTRDIHDRIWNLGIEGIPKLIHIDRSKNMWFFVHGKGVYNYNIKSGTLNYFGFSEATIPSGEIINFADCKDGVLLIYNNGTVVCADKEETKTRWTLDDIKHEINGSPEFFAAFEDSDNDLWIYGPLGLWIYSIENKEWKKDLEYQIKFQSCSNMVRSVVQDIDGRIWIGKDQEGIDIINKETGEIRCLKNRADDERSLQNNTINALYADKDKSMWVGTFKKGISYYNESTFKFDIRHLGDINCFEEDKDGYMWLGTNDAGLIRWNLKTYHKEIFNQNKPNTLTSDAIVCIHKARNGKLWIGTFWGGLNCYDNGRFTHYQNIPGNKNSLANNNVWALTEDNKGNIWIGTLGGGVQCLNPQTGEFKTFSIASSGFLSDHVSSLFLAKNNNLLIGTSRGMTILDINTGKVTNMMGTKSGSKVLSNININQVVEDSRGLIWIATRDLVNIYNPKTDELDILTMEDGISNPFIAGIIEDDNKNMWLSTARGVTNVIVETDRKNNYNYYCYSYDHKDGLQSCEFNQRSVYKLSSGEILIGGLYGVNGVSTKAFKYNKTEPNVIFTQLTLFNEKVEIGEKYDNRVILDKAINHIEAVELNYQHNIFSVQFSSDNYVLPEKMKYSYKLEGFSNEWLTTGVGKATFTNLAPGKYTLKVKATNNDGYTSKNEASLNIIIHPPFWLTTFAFIVYGIIFVLILLLGRHMILKSERNKYKIQQIKNEAIKNQEINDMKLRFFTNISHDLRTPLTLIISPLEILMKEYETDDMLSDKLKMIHRNSVRLLNLVNQLLDFRKGDVNGHHLSLSNGDIIEYISLICKSFNGLSETKNVHLTFFSSVKSLNISFDEDKIGKVVMNLLSNAFKFTPDGGRVDVSLDLIRQQEKEFVEIKFTDTGIGIDDNDKKHIFDRFYQVDHSHSSGSGIGLNIVRDFVELHGGSVRVYDNVPAGTVFLVHIPANRQEKDYGTASYGQLDTMELICDEKLTGEKAERHIQEHEDSINSQQEDKRPVVMIVDDNDDFLTFMYDSLIKNYQVKIATNGREAWEMLPSVMPDIIISDVMMPQMDGRELCKLVKSNKETSKIPLILLSARSSTEFKLEGLKLGCDDYVTKPFNMDILSLKIQKLISNHNKQTRSKIDPSPSTIQITSMDEKLIENAVKYVEKNMSRSDFSVEELSQELGMSRVHLYKKLLAITNKTPIEFIRVIRLKRAAQLLRESQQNVSEIAYQVGFNNPKYFSKYFKEEFGELPSTYQEREGR